MSEVVPGKGKTTMVDIVHGHTNTGSSGGCLSMNYEPLMLDLIKAVRAIQLHVTVPPMGAPDVTVNTPETPPAAVTVNVPPQEKTQIMAAPVKQWPLVCVAILVWADVVTRLWEILR